MADEKVMVSDDDKQDDDIKKSRERTLWTRQIEFTLSCVGFSVSLGNIWRFPYLCMRNGGGAFLIPYFTCLLLCGMPVVVLELVLGQFGSCGATGIWNLCPLFKGVGWAAINLNIVTSIYYNTLIGWVLYYLGMSMRSEVPWKTCNNTWNTPDCFLFNVKSPNATTLLGEISHNASESNLTQYSNEMFHVNHTSAAEEFFHNKVLDMSDGIHDLGPIKWDLMICLFVAGLSLYLCIFKGVKSTGKVIYFSVVIPYIFLLILLVRGVTLPGSLEGIKYYIIPDWKRLTEFKVWAEACIQVFFSLGPGWGGLVSMASYNKFNNYCIRDGIIASVSCAMTSFFAGFVIYSVIGFMAYDVGQSVDSVITQGPGLAFIAYPEAIAKLPLSTFWAICFFLMLFFLGLDSQFVCLEVAVTCFIDMYPQYLKKRRALFIGAMTLLFFLLGLPFVTRGGMYIFQIVDWYCFSVSILLIAIFECLVVSYAYGIGRLYNDMYLMFGHVPSLVWAVLWAGITPLILIVIFLYSVARISPPYYGDYVYPGWAIALGWGLASSSAILIPIVGCYQLRITKGSIIERLALLTKANSWWGPRLPEDRMRDKFSLEPHSWRQRFFIWPSTDMTSQNGSVEQLPLKHAEKV